jgi:hypothetical protein
VIPKGRCAGPDCGVTGELSLVKSHVIRCPAWARLYREDRGAALDPGPEYARWLAEDRDQEHAEDLAARTADTVRRVAGSRARFAGVGNILGDE